MKRLIKKVLRYLVGNNPVQQEEALPSVNLKKGSNVQYWPSTIFQTSGNGLIELGNGVYVGRDVELSADTRYLLIQEESSIQDRCILIGEVEIGRYCTFAPNVYISSGRHYYDFKPEYYIRDQDSLVQQTPELAKHHSKKVIVEDDCWLGINVVVMSGITIGKGSVIGANSVVTKNVEPYSVMAGAPAKLIKKRLDFVLKDELQYSEDADLPNFYSGFLTELKKLKESREKGGVRTQKDFSVYMNHVGKNQIRIVLKQLQGASIEIAYNNQVKAVNEEYAEIVFDIAHEPYHKFSLINNSATGGETSSLTALVKSVFVQ